MEVIIDRVLAAVFTSQSLQSELFRAISIGYLYVLS